MAQGDGADLSMEEDLNLPFAPEERRDTLIRFKGEAMNENDLYQALLRTADRVRHLDPAGAVPLDGYRHLVRTETWQQRWDTTARVVGDLHTVTGEVWSDAIERCLAENGSAVIPRLTTPLYLDRPIEVKGGDRLIIHPETELRLKPGNVGTCMLRNESLRSSKDRPVELAAGADPDILVEGGIWSDQQNQGRGLGGTYDQQGTMPGSGGVFLLQNLSCAVVRNVRFRDCSCHAVQIGNIADFLVEHIAFDETADGIHVNGPASRGIIRHISGKTNDDAVAVNAWDWGQSTLTFGPITDILVEDVEVQPGYTWSELRLLPGTKVFPDGSRVACDICRCVYRNIRGLHTFKIYDQPNISNPEEDFADPIGHMADLFFSDIVVEGIPRAGYYDKSSDGVFDLCAEIENISIRNVRLNYLPGENDMIPYLVSVGPKALTWSREGAAGKVWFEVFNPEANPVVRGLVIENVSLPAAGGHAPCTDVAKLVHARSLTLNPDFPASLPRGGTGQGSIPGWS